MPTIKLSDISHLLFNSAAEGLLVADHTGTILLSNSRLDEMFGYEPQALIGGKVEQLVPPNVRTQHNTHRQHYHDKPVKRSMGLGRDLSAVRKDGTSFPVEISLNHFEIDGQKLAMALISDITQRKQLDHELKALNSRLEQEVKDRTRELVLALEREKTINEMKSRFVSMASHEFRTPLSAILSSASLAEKYGERNDQEKQQKHFARIRSSVTNMTDILNDFLSVDQLEQGALNTESTSFNLAELMAEVLEQMSGLCKMRQRILHQHEGNELVHADRKIILNILLNLLSNAIKYSEQNISLYSRLTNDQVQIKVSDRGLGIPENEQKHLFEKFFRAGNVTNIQGTGLGLSIVKRYVELLDGTLSFESSEGIGTTFTVEFASKKL